MKHLRLKKFLWKLLTKLDKPNAFLILQAKPGETVLLFGDEGFAKFYRHLEKYYADSKIKRRKWAKKK